MPHDDYAEVELLRWELRRRVERARYIQMSTTTLLVDAKRRIAALRPFLYREKRRRRLHIVRRRRVPSTLG